jgi:hypothetical protein
MEGGKHLGVAGKQFNSVQERGSDPSLMGSNSFLGMNSWRNDHPSI